MKKLHNINTSINDLRVVLKQSNERQSAFELNEIIKDTKDARAFIFLLDRFDTDKEITRETLEELIECTHDFNGLVIEHIEKIEIIGCASKFDIDKLFTFKNAKMAIVASILVGLILGVANNEVILKSALKHIGIQVIKDEAVPNNEDNEDNGGKDVK